MAPRHKETDRQQIRGDTRQRLLAAATEEFARQGYESANINAISRAAGFAKGTVYNYFASKRALMLAIIDQTASTHLAFIRGPVESEKDPGRRLLRFFEAGFAFVTSHLAPARVMINTLYGPDVEFKQHMYQAYQPMFQLVSRDILAPGIARGEFRPLDADATATLLMTIYLGTASQVDAEGRIWLDPGQVADFAWHALRYTDQISKEVEEYEDPGIGG
jgi:AcrR family transcriptional regulator